ncbi:hypothetical protein JCM6882_007832 [Rhodosporidiobolus microsporus]
MNPLTPLARSLLPPSLTQKLSQLHDRLRPGSPSHPEYHDELEQIYRAAPSVWLNVFFSHRGLKEGVKAVEGALRELKEKNDKRGRRWLKKVPGVKDRIEEREDKAEERCEMWREALATFEKSGPFLLLRLREDFLGFVLAHTAENPEDPTPQEVADALTGLPGFPGYLDVDYLNAVGRIRIKRKQSHCTAPAPRLARAISAASSASASSGSRPSLFTTTTRTSSSSTITTCTSIRPQRYLESAIPAHELDPASEDQDDAAAKQAREEELYTFPFLLRDVLPRFEDPVAPNLRHIPPPEVAKARAAERKRQEEQLRELREVCFEGWPW